MRRVGILGGMGPQATVLLMQKLIAAIPAHDDADHIPLIVDQNTQVPSRIAHLLEGRGEDPGPVLAAMARGLVAAGAEALAMPCNTAHHYAPAIRAAVDVPFIDMVALTMARVQQLAPAGAVIGVLGSPALRRTGLLDRALATQGFRATYPACQDAMLAAIRAIKSDGPVPAARTALSEASDEMLARGARLQLIACTEFSLIADALPTGRAIDTLDVLVEAIKEYAVS